MFTGSNGGTLLKIRRHVVPTWVFLRRRVGLNSSTSEVSQVSSISKVPCRSLSSLDVPHYWDFYMYPRKNSGLVTRSHEDLSMSKTRRVYHFFWWTLVSFCGLSFSPISLSLECVSTLITDTDRSDLLLSTLSYESSQNPSPLIVIWFTVRSWGIV